MNLTGIIKSIFIVGMATFVFLMPINYVNMNTLPFILQFTIGALIGWIIFGTLILYVLIKFFGGTVTKPNWNNNPLNFKEPFNLIQFIGIGAIIIGLGNLTGFFVENSSVSLFGLQFICTGIGLLISMKVSERILTGTNMR